MNTDKVKEVLSKYEKDILKLPGVVGVSTGIRKDKMKEWCIKVYLNKAIERGNIENQQLPVWIESVYVEAILSGNFNAL
jgi:hypothetical protein